MLSTLRGEIEVKAHGDGAAGAVHDRRQARAPDRHAVGVRLEGYAKGDIANVLLAMHGDANTSIHSTKALTCNLRKGRLAHAGGESHGQ